MNKHRVIAILTVFILTAAMAAAMFHWLRPPVLSLQKRLALPAGTVSVDKDAPSVFSELSFRAGPGLPAANDTADWPSFRGSNRDAIAEFSTSIARDWRTSPPAIRWSITLGEGHAGAAVRNGRVYLLDYDRDNRRDLLRCMSLDTGSAIWSVSYPVTIKRNHGMSRTVPAVTDQFLVTLGPKGHVVCLNSISGEFLWGIDLVREYQTIIPEWYAGQCPLIDNGRAIIAPAGTTLMMACDLPTGQVLWQTSNPDHAQMTHSSIMPVVIDGQRLYLYCADIGLYGIAADDGRIVFFFPDWTITIATIATPVPLDDNKIFLSGGYNVGSMIIELHPQPGGDLSVETISRFPARTFGADQQTPIYYKKHIFGVRPDRRLVCMNLQGQILWHSGNDRFGLGPFTIVNDLLFALADTGTLFMVRASADAYEPLAQYQVLSGHDAWAPIACAEPFLLMRDLTTFICLDLSPN